MTTTITSGTTTITPTLVLGYSASSDTQTLVHPLIGTAAPSVTLRPDTSRAGTLQLYFPSASSAHTARTALLAAKVWTLASTEISQIGMTFVRDGEMSLELDEDDMTSWVLGVGFREV